jgi:2-dehydro-3-deoxyglucarate aldolase
MMSRAVQRCKTAGTPVGTLGATPDAVAQYRAIGFDYLAVSSDIGFMMRSAKEAIAALRTPDTEHVHTLATGTQASTL